MPCTTLLVGKKASYDGSTMVARNEDSGSGSFTEKKKIVVHPQDQPRLYKSVLSHLEIPLPDNPMTYTATPDAFGRDGIWAAFGVNEANVSMTATETLTSNERVLGADPLVRYQEDSQTPGGIGEEDIVTLTLPYIHSAREGVLRLGHLLSTYGTYEMNGIAFQDQDEIWWLETIGGHHWIAKRVPDDHYVMMPNQLGIDAFDLEDAYGDQVNHLCSPDLRDFIHDNFLDLSHDGSLNPRLAFGSHSDADHVYNTPRAWVMGRYFNGQSASWDGPEADYHPESDQIPWAMVPDRKITVEDVKYILSHHYQGTPYDVFHPRSPRKYRPIGINRNNVLGMVQIRPYLPKEIQCLEWITYGSNTYNAWMPYYANVDSFPDYLSQTGPIISTDSFYWTNRLLAAMADPHYDKCQQLLERYQLQVQSAGRALLKESEQAALALIDQKPNEKQLVSQLEEANQAIADKLKEETDKLLHQVLALVSDQMQNRFARND